MNLTSTLLAFLAFSHVHLSSGISRPFPPQAAPLSTFDSKHNGNKSSWRTIPRGGESAIQPEQATSVATMAVDAVKGLQGFVKGSRSDVLILLLTTALNAPICKAVGTSPILGLLALGILLGPNGYNLIADLHRTELMADLGIVFFLFEMGIHLDFKTLMSMRRDVFGLGGSQFLLTGAVVAIISKLFGLSAAASIVLGGGLALSSSAFVLQLLKDKQELGTQFGKSSFGVLLLQDLAVVPLLVVTPILAGNGGGLASALGSAAVQASIALATIALAGRFFITPFFDTVASVEMQETFVGAILFVVLGMSFLTEGLGLSNTLGAFLAGVLLSETKHRHRVEKEIAPFRGILVGLFFFSVGFEIDLRLISSQPLLVASVAAGIVALKAAIAAVLSVAFGLSHGTAQRIGLILSQGGEFGFVAFKLARSQGIFSDDLAKLMLTCISLTMSVTPFLNEVGDRMAPWWDAGSNRITLAARKAQ